MTERGAYLRRWRRAWRIADATGLPHLFYAGGHWRVARPVGYKYHDPVNAARRWADTH